MVRPGALDEAGAQILGRVFGMLGRLPLLSDAEAADMGAAISARRERLPLLACCVLCGRGRVTACMVLGPSDLVGPACWVDTCWRCWSALHAVGSAHLSDGEILAYYEEWRARADGGEDVRGAGLHEGVRGAGA